MQEQHGLSQRRACELAGCNRSTARHVSRRQDDPVLRERMKQLADENRAWGYRLLCGKLRLEGFRVNHKRVHRIYQEEQLALRPRTRQRIKGEKRGHPPDPAQVNEVWTLDFVSDALQNGRSFRTLNLLDAFTRQCHCIEVDTSLGGCRVVRVLDQLVLRHGKPKRLQIDNGPEFRCQLLEEWAQRNGVELYFIDRASPTRTTVSRASTAASARSV